MRRTRARRELGPQLVTVFWCLHWMQHSTVSISAGNTYVRHSTRGQRRRILWRVMHKPLMDARSQQDTLQTQVVSEVCAQGWALMLIILNMNRRETCLREPMKPCAHKENHTVMDRALTRRCLMKLPFTTVHLSHQTEFAATRKIKQQMPAAVVHARH